MPTRTQVKWERNEGLPGLVLSLWPLSLYGFSSTFHEGKSLFQFQELHDLFFLLPYYSNDSRYHFCLEGRDFNTSPFSLSTITTTGWNFTFSTPVSHTARGTLLLRPSSRRPPLYLFLHTPTVLSPTPGVRHQSPRGPLERILGASIPPADMCGAL